MSLTAQREIIVDNFAGGGGASTGIWLATGRHPDIAVNHDDEALAMHEANHPGTEHFCESVWDVDPRKVTAGRPVGLAWFSPDCKHFSKAKGGKPVDKNIRGLAWAAVRWAATVKPRILVVENVEEFVTWGPLVEGPDGKLRPCPKRKGQEFNAFTNALRRHGYRVEYRELRACDYGAPTIRNRLFLVARRDGMPIRWPRPTHGDPRSPEVLSGQRLPWRTAAECIDWSIPCPSIFERKRPLADATLRRIAKGLMRYVVNSPDPFIVPVTHQGDHRVHGMDEPLHTVSAGGNHFAEVRAFLIQYYGSDGDPRIDEPLHTATTKDRFGLVTVNGCDYAITEIGLRMLSPRELFRAQGFPDSYIIGDDRYQGLKLTKEAQVRMCGNSVCPPVAAALIEANLMRWESVRQPAAGVEHVLPG